MCNFSFSKKVFFPVGKLYLNSFQLAFLSLICSIIRKDKNGLSVKGIKAVVQIIMLHANLMNMFILKSYRNNCLLLSRISQQSLDTVHQR